MVSFENLHHPPAPNPFMNVSQDLRQTLQEVGECFLQEFLEVEISRHPENREALAELGQLYTTRGLWDKGLAVDQQLVRLLPTDNLVHYNLACSHSLLGQLPLALKALERAVECGYRDHDFMRDDEDLRALREDTQFRALLERIRSMNP